MGLSLFFLQAAQGFGRGAEALRLPHKEFPMANHCPHGAQQCALGDSSANSRSSLSGGAGRSELRQLAQRVQTLLARGQCALDPQLLQALVELGDRARAVARCASASANLLAILQDLQEYNLFDATGTECAEALVVLKQRARRAASGAPDALWSLQAEQDLLEEMLQAGDEETLDGLLLELAQASGYLAAIDVGWRHWHYGRHAEHARELGMDAALQRLLASGWQIQHHVLGATTGDGAERMRTQIRSRHLAAQEGVRGA